ncbi:hypothetical protein B9J09_03060 [Xylella fastidiosa subsp. pauca]|nr:hypothetical protein B9J09_03060 [Xylella fastidiosa subsp. pauca]AVI20317.1 hypothetical protein BCV75_02855 [Xylella fastidiosa]AVI22325.1 hypothetical protein BC375_02875 [Xylella fastidiosa]KIA57604.1 hypothetical protein RA12_10495 [Xylella fastidiosa]KXB12523.1 hypothetical protein ADT32_03640 [Xylella fastidiosa]
MVIGGGGDGAGREQGGKAAVAGCSAVSLGCIGCGFLCLIFAVYITIFWLCKGGKGVGGVDVLFCGWGCRQAVR